MKKSLLIITICSMLSIGFHVYLSFRSQALMVGNVESSALCSINDYMNCDSTLSSRYSEFAGIPLSHWGIGTNLIIGTLAVSLLLGLMESSASLWLIFAFFTLLSSGASLLMFGLSFFILKVLCPVCCVLYVLSFLILACFLKIGWRFIPPIRKWRINKFIIGVMISWLVLSFLSYLTLMNANNMHDTSKRVNSSIMDWESSPLYTVETPALLEIQTSVKPNLNLIEFADFLCSHCRNLFYSIKVFKASHPNVRLQFFSFPLDNCRKGGVSCFLSKIVHCAEKQKQGWFIHDLIFENQSSFILAQSPEEALEVLQNLTADKNLNWKSWQQCAETDSSLEFIKRQIEAGKKIDIHGTPTLLVNERKMNPRYFIPVVTKILETLPNP